MTFCPGRHIAMKEVIAVVGLLLGRFDVTILEAGSSFPGMDENKPCLGVMAPFYSADIRLVVKELV